MPVKSIKIIKPGSITMDAFEQVDSRLMAFKNLSGVGGGSTVTYIESDARILVDTGFDYENNLTDENVKQNRKNLVHALKNFGLKPGDIDIVFMTHWHVDHFGNVRVFKNSSIITSEAAVEKCRIKVRGAKDGEKIADGVTVIHTPGHTRDHASLLVETERLRYSIPMQAGGRILGIGEVKVCIAGDSVLTPGFYLADKIWHHNADFYSEDAARESIKRIVASADYVVPGHGSIFKVPNIKE